MSGMKPALSYDAEPSAGTHATFSASPHLLTRLRDIDASLIFTSYQSNLLYMLGRNGQGGLNVHHTPVAKPMGIAAMPEGAGFFLATERSIEHHTNGLRDDQRVNDLFDANYVPRTIHLTGALDAHDVGIAADGTPIFVNTRFNCLAKPSPTHAFEPIWRPNFISGLVDEDRCHLNGLGMRDGQPAFVTAVSKSDTIDGWRDRRADGGVIIDVATDEIVCTGLSMPHSPRWHNDALWVLNSGTGELGRVDLDNGTLEPAAFCPGFVRGLSFHGNLAFVGLSKPRYKRFEGLALDARLTEKDSEPWCGLQVIDLDTGACVDWFRLDGDVGEIYDVALLHGVRTPMSISAGSPEAAAFITFTDKSGQADT
ncbi:MAG: TIGR03032 family protein [Pseudomonadota bacterium]